MKNELTKLFVDRLDLIEDTLPEKFDSQNASYLLKITEDIFSTGIQNTIDKRAWQRYLDLSRFPIFLQSLKHINERYRWAETVFKAISASNYSIRDLIEQRTIRHPDKVLFTTVIENLKNEYSYKLIENRIRKIATAFLYVSNFKPRAAIYSDNSIDSACCDLACLTYDIPDSPLHPQFGLETLGYIFSKINFNIVITDTYQRLEILRTLRDKTGKKFEIFFTGASEAIGEDVIQLDQILSLISSKDIPGILSKRKKLKLDEIATTMFTSGSTGMPKGVQFSIYNLISKRFARAAVLPKVGNNELLVSYLPLYHTFGRYLELLGMIFWGGTYVFAGRNDVDSILNLMRAFQPTGLVGIPLRWKQISEKFHEIAEKEGSNANPEKIFSELVGKNLIWGLSAAGYLEPKVFKFFNKYGVELCSGFGMTEATGGISMTMPGEYIKDSVGIPLPGMKINFSPGGELKIAGHYVAKYLDDDNKDLTGEQWLSTGDLFKQDDNGSLYIIDRVKDIYKNSKGQTIAPAYIEKKFEFIPGLKRAFLVGDMKPNNTLLIVPDYEDPFIKSANSQHILTEYFSTIVASVNSSLNPFERIIKFSILKRNFSEEKGELTAKGTFKRKTIEANFHEEIELLYQKSRLDYNIGELRIIIPFWILKDLGLTQDDIEAQQEGIYDKQHKKLLIIRKKNGHIRIGDFEYIIKSDIIDLGTFVRQPILWMGNINMIGFAVCKSDWDFYFTDISSQISIDFSGRKRNFNIENISNTSNFDSGMFKLNREISTALFGKSSSQLEAIHELEDLLKIREIKLENLISRRLETLSSHPSFAVRSLAYKILLINQPEIDYNRYLPSFINSKRIFLNKKVIEEISYSQIEGFRFKALSIRMEAYRKGLQYPLAETELRQFKRILDMFTRFVYGNPSTYSLIRAELIKWILHQKDRRLSRYARLQFKKIAKWFESTFKLSPYETVKENWCKKIIYQDIITQSEKDRIDNILFCSTFLKEAFFLIFDHDKFDLEEVNDRGIYISQLSASRKRLLYHLSINTKSFKHYDLVILITPNLTRKKVLDTIYLTIKIAHNSTGISILPRLGNFRSNQGIISFDFINDLTVWEKIRQLTSAQSSINKKEYEIEWEILFRRGISAYFAVLKNSDYKVIPGNISPSNVVVPEPYFKEGIKVISIAGWKEYLYPLALITPILNNFYIQTTSHYPWCREHLKIDWIFEACLEGLGYDEGIIFLSDLKKEIYKSDTLSGFDIRNKLSDYLERIKNEPFVDSYIKSAIKNYNDWVEENLRSTKKAKSDFIQNLYSMYRMENYPEIIRYIFYANTYFFGFSDEVNSLFKKLTDSLFKFPKLSSIKRIELVELQELITDKIDKEVLNRLVFPKLALSNSKIEVAASGENSGQDVLLMTKVPDTFGIAYSIRKPVSPSEIGALHRLFIIDNYPVKINNELNYLLIMDNDEENTIGGICYRILYPKIANIEGIEISKSFRGRGLAAKLIEDFCKRLTTEGIKTVTTHFYLKSFFERFNFKMDKRYGGLVRFLK